MENEPNMRAGMVGKNLFYNQGDVPAKKTVGGMSSMETPSYFTFLEKNYSALKSGGITTAIVSDEPDSETISPVTCQVKCATLTDGSQQLFEKGDFLFAYKGESRNEDEAIIFNLQTLNYWLEEAYIVRNSNRMMETLEPEKMANGRKRRYGSDLLYSFPVTLEEFKSKISFVGIMLGANGVKQIRSRDISYGVSGVVRDVPNIFGPIEENSTLEFRVKCYKNKYQGKVHYDGSITKDITMGTFLQVRPFVNKNLHPVIHHKIDVMQEDDLDYLEQVIVKQIVLDESIRRPGSGLIAIDGNGTSEKVIIDVDLPVEGLCITIGNVQQFKRTTNYNDANMGVRSIPAATKIAKDGGFINISLDLMRRKLTHALDDF